MHFVTPYRSLAQAGFEFFLPLKQNLARALVQKRVFNANVSLNFLMAR
jgi:hypothetical protein